MRVLILLLLLALIPMPAIAKPGTGWKAHRVVVRNQAGPEWTAAIQEAIAGVNRRMPKRGPKLIYRAGGQSCKRPKRGIAICARPGGNDFTVSRVAGGYLRSAVINLDAPAAYGDHADRVWAVCHELLHATTRAPERKVPHAEPCPFNERFAKKVYRRHR